MQVPDDDGTFQKYCILPPPFFVASYVIYPSYYDDYDNNSVIGTPQARRSNVNFVELKFKPRSSLTRYTFVGLAALRYMNVNDGLFVQCGPSFSHGSTS